MKTERKLSYYGLDKQALGIDVQATTDQETLPLWAQTHLNEVQRARSVPSWVRNLETNIPNNKFRWLKASWMGMGIAAATAAAVLIAVQPKTLHETGSHPSYTAAKGYPSVAVFIKRGSKVRLWDGEEFLQPGDQLRLQINREGFHFISVFSVSEKGDAELLHSSQLQNTKTQLLAEAWKVDAKGNVEQLLVVLSQREGFTEQAGKLWNTPRRDNEVWTIRLLAKKVATGARP